MFRLGRIPFRSARDLVADHAALLNQLARGLGVDRVELRTAPDYDGVVRMLLAGQVEAAWVGTVSYLDARNRKDVGDQIVPILCPLRHDRTWYHGTIFCRADSGISGLAQLKGRRVAFVDPESGSGYAVPRRMLEAAGVKVPGDLLTLKPGEPDFLGKHDSVVMAVYLKRFEAGAAYDESIQATFAQTPAKAGELRVLARTPAIYNEPILVRTKTPAAARERIVEAFTRLVISDQARLDLGGITGFAPVEASAYDPLDRQLGGRP